MSQLGVGRERPIFSRIYLKKIARKVRVAMFNNAAGSVVNCFKVGHSGRGVSRKRAAKNQGNAGCNEQTEYADPTPPRHVGRIAACGLVCCANCLEEIMFAGVIEAGFNSVTPLA